MLTIQELQTKCEEILKTLPLAHYLKVSSIPVAFDNASQTSYFDPTQFRIVVAFNNIAMVIKSKQALPNNTDLEKTIRCFLYHEVSHAIMTPNNLMSYAASSNSLLTPQFANIIEDERIETLLKKYYLGVDFKENLKNAAPLDKHIKSFEHFVFNCVRHRCSPIMAEQVNRLVDRFILDTKDISASGDVHYLISKMAKLLEELKNIFDMLPKQKSQNQNQQDNESSQSETEEQKDNSSSRSNNSQESSNNENEENGSTEESSSSSSNCEEENERDSNEESEEEIDNADSEESALSNEEAAEEQNQMEENSQPLNSNVDNKLSAEDIEKSIQNQMLMNKQAADSYGSYKIKLSDFSYEKDTKVAMLKIIGRNIGFGKKQNQAQFGYSGKFNTKKFSTDFNDSCKWFKKRAYEETGLNNKKNNTKVLNIWLDNSGSYGKNDLDTNRILSALQSIEKSRDDFEFNLITFSYDFHEKSGEDRISCSNGGTHFNGKSKMLYKKYNPTGNELNIVLIDGGISDNSLFNLDERVAELVAQMQKELSSNNISKEDYDKWYANIQKQVSDLKKRANDNTEESGYNHFKWFNNKKSTFITEYSNEIGIKHFAPQANLIVENNNYTEQLKRNILKAFDLLF